MTHPASPGIRRPRTRLAALGLLLALPACDLRAAGEPAAAAPAQLAPAEPQPVTALGRIEPKNRIRHIAGPSRPSVVLAALLIDEGDHVPEGAPIAVLDTLVQNEANVVRARAEVEHAQRALGRIGALKRQGVVAETELENAQLAAAVAEAELAKAEAALRQDTVYAPANGQIIAVHTRSGERVGPEGIAELAQTDEMYAVAEVYETDIGRVQIGQAATITSPALPAALAGRVERVGMKIGKLDLLDTDPVARTDARVVEVYVKLDDPTQAASLSNLQVEVAIAPPAVTAQRAAR